MGNLSEESEERLGDYRENPDPPEETDDLTDFRWLLRQAVLYEAAGFEADDGTVEAGDLLEWFSDWRKRANTALNRFDGLPEDTSPIGDPD